ncbi:MAG TPA: CARDB domain-containing protein [Gaiellaceae bacterium]
MSERDVDNIDFDFFEEEEEPTQESSRAERVIRRPGGPRGPRRPSQAPQNLTPLLRLVGLIAFAILIIVLLVFWIQSCQASSKSSTYKNYMTKVSEVASSSQQIGRQLGNTLLAPGLKRAQLQSKISGLARQEQLNVDRAQGITPPGPLLSEHQAVIQALQYRVSGLTGLADALGATASSKNTTKSAAALAAQMQRLLASDVIWADSFNSPAEAELRRQGVTGTNSAGGPLVPGSSFLQNSALASASAMTTVVERLKGSSAGTQNCPCGTELLGVKVLPSAKDLSTTTQTDIVVTANMSFQVSVKNSGNVQVFSVPVKLTIEQSKGGNIVKTAKIGFLNTGDTTTVTFRNFPQVNFSTPATIKVEVSPVAGETKTDNNSADFPVIFSVA